ncbi:SDR family oxidoreductase [Actinoplanes sp. NPDC020271]|uniref:SDR family oxidoreductase n=1 Tax=Actinoplanes sp. NPDC020271 TaxID=3363896 RepID=UPI0037B20B5E
MTQQRVAIVTGASRGIGRAIARKLAAEGAAVVVGYSGNTVAATEVVDEITADGGQAFAVAADIAGEHAVEAMFAQAEERFGGIDVVVNSAGVLALAPIADLDLDDLDRMHRTNIRGAFVVARESARRLRPGGSLVLISTSVVGLRFPTYAGYTASKGAVEAIPMILARELRGRDVTVNAVAPGPTATDLFLEGKDQTAIDSLAKQPPLERLGTPEDIAATVAFVASAAGHWINGQVIRANGGII